MVTGFVDFDVAIVADGFEESKEWNFVVSETRPCLVGANVLDENGSGGESREKKALPEAPASLQPLVCRFPHSEQQLKLVTTWSCRFWYGRGSAWRKPSKIKLNKKEIKTSKNKNRFEDWSSFVAGLKLQFFWEVRLSHNFLL